MEIHSISQKYMNVEIKLTYLLFSMYLSVLCSLGPAGSKSFASPKRRKYALILANSVFLIKNCKITIFLRAAFLCETIVNDVTVPLDLLYLSESNLVLSV